MPSPDPIVVERRNAVTEKTANLEAIRKLREVSVRVVLEFLAGRSRLRPLKHDPALKGKRLECLRLRSKRELIQVLLAAPPRPHHCCGLQKRQHDGDIVA